ncbi:MAG TPA: DUF6157 family protein [Actinomycetota bacterium]|nr:DUF6157 family protein [Actinomycetota bacterium]
MKTTNYYDTFIEVADDCPVTRAEIPPRKGKDKTVANLQYDFLHAAPYQHTSDDVLFHVHAIKNNIASRNAAAARDAFFSKGQPCFRSSPLTKRYGWGVHSDSKGRIALYAMDSKEYAMFARDKHVKHLKAMRSKRA